MKNPLFLHLGGGEYVLCSEILGIFDIENTSVSKITRDFLRAAPSSCHIVSLSPDLPKSFVLCSSDNGFTLYICQLSPATLRKRLL